LKLAFLVVDGFICALDMSSETIESARGVEFLAWLEVNKTRLIVGAVVVAIVVSAFVIHRWRIGEREAAASSALVRAQSIANVSSDAERPGADVFLKIASDYRSTQAGTRALLFGAQALFQEGRYAESQAQFEAYLKADPMGPLAAIGAFGVAVCNDALGKTNEAFQSYQEVVSRHAASAVASQAKLAMADLYAARGEPAQALRLFDDLASTAWAREAAMRRERLLLRHPELAETDEAASMPEVSMPLTGDSLDLPAVTTPEGEVR
jgi:predicted negative regulator of RcsB-dependent stress response